MSNYWNTEKPIQRFGMNTLIGMGFYVDRVNSGEIQTKSGSWVKLAQKGTPDSIAHRLCPHGCCSCSQLLRPEFKTQKGKVSDMQTEKMKALEEAGAHCYVIRSEEEVYLLKKKIQNL